MARVSITGKVGNTVRAGRMANLARDKAGILRPPRLKPIKTRDYGKAGASDPMAYPGAGFGQTGLTGES